MFYFLAIDWASVGIQAFYLILSLSILVILHEFGHYLPAKIFKCKVEKFYLFFDPWFSLFKKKIGETVYGIGWLPLGGYVKIAGMVDESMDKEQMKKPPQPWEFRSKPAWQRLIIMIGGVTVNVLVAFIIYAMILFTWGEEKLPNANAKDGITVMDSVMYQMGLKDGDKILAVNEDPVPYFDDIPKKLLVGERVTVERDGKTQVVQLPVDLLGKLIEKKRSRTPLFTPRVPMIVGLVADSSPALQVGLKPYDRVISVDSVTTPFFDNVRTELYAHRGQQVALQIEREGKQFTVNPTITSDGKLGVYHFSYSSELDSLGILKIERRKYGFFEAFPAGVRMAVDNLIFYIDQFRKILSPETGAYKGVGGFKSMGSIFPKQWGDWQAFWSITAFFSIILAFMNLLPIPALDGGHVVFTLYEMITGRKPNDKFLEYAQIVGMIFLLGLMVYANGNDWFGWNRNK
ncbi:MAG: RIP metalloprotease RseP [Chitinophagaceae bacterium]|nr:MAG: RIP metalloprotease RseP [Chitinophagaceae bacterium]